MLLLEVVEVVLDVAQGRVTFRPPPIRPGSGWRDRPTRSVWGREGSGTGTSQRPFPGTPVCAPGWRAGVGVGVETRTVGTSRPRRRTSGRGSSLPPQSRCGAGGGAWGVPPLVRPLSPTLKTDLCGRHGLGEGPVPCSRSDHEAHRLRLRLRTRRGDPPRSRDVSQTRPSEGCRTHQRLCPRPGRRPRGPSLTSFRSSSGRIRT